MYVYFTTKRKRIRYDTKHCNVKIFLFQITSVLFAIPILVNLVCKVEIVSSINQLEFKMFCYVFVFVFVFIIPISLTPHPSSLLPSTLLSLATNVEAMKLFLSLWCI